MIPMHSSLPSFLRRHACAGMLPLLLLTGCAVGPDYTQPVTELPASFRHQEGWQATAAIRHTQAADTNWWAAYGDADLDHLLREIDRSNPTLAQAEAQWRQARALVDSARAAGRPSATAGVSGSRTGGNTTTGNSRLYQATLDVSWLPDIWGKVRRQTEAAQADADTVAALRDASRLALQLTAAEGYVRVRALDRHLSLMASALTAYERSLQLTRHQYEAGFVARADVIQAETQLQALRTQRMTVARQRTLEEHALAMLTGRTPSQWQLAAREEPLPMIPGAPSVLPAALLVQRPDVAAAERQVAAANSRIGVAAGAWLPDLSLGAAGTWRSGSWSGLWDAPTRVWSLGPTLAVTLFDGGARRAAREIASAQYDERAAAWRGAVLQAIRETEDALLSLSSLTAQDEQQQRLVALASENERVVTQRYQAGEITFLEVATAQNLALESRRNALDVQASRLTASMQLIASLGGGWQVVNAN